VDIAAFDDHVAEIDANTKNDLLIIGDGGIPHGHAVLYGGRAGNRFNDARELDENAVAGGLDDAAPVLGYLGIN
jgi:hypothetical protein